MTDVTAYAYQRIANALRARILSDELKPGARLPSEADLRQRYRVSRATVCRALGALCAEVPERIDTVALGPDDVARARMPAPDERARLRLAEGVPVLVVTCCGGKVHVYPGDRTNLVRSR